LFVLDSFSHGSRLASSLDHTECMTRTSLFGTQNEPSVAPRAPPSELKIFGIASSRLVASESTRATECDARSLRSVASPRRRNLSTSERSSAVDGKASLTTR
jgi:hypothetical protein